MPTTVPQRTKSEVGIKYIRNAQVFAALIIGIIWTLSLVVEHEKRVIFTDSLAGFLANLASIIEAIVRNHDPKIEMPHVLSNTAFIDSIKRHKDTDMLTIMPCGSCEPRRALKCGTQIPAPCLGLSCVYTQFWLVVE
ncbi:hypothetical protein BC830DRAFT_168486 [Chytriomyces sp. MP71]|nr:hypothetical protein BC830DRAFT_168486 [Chytriomyces sp. MP71]